MVVFWVCGFVFLVLIFFFFFFFFFFSDDKLDLESMSLILTTFEVWPSIIENST